jgi:glycosyltransferase involved in cell wall biosynthesis
MNRKVLINGRFLGRSVTGVDRFAIEVLRAMDELYDSADVAISGLDIEVLAPTGATGLDGLRHIAIREVGSMRGQIWEQFSLQREVGDALLVNLCNTAPLIPRKQLVVIHDAATARAPTSYSKTFRLWYSVLIPLLYKRAASVCTVSQFSKEDLATLYGVRDDVRVLPEGTEHMERTHPDLRVLEKVGLTKRPYVLAVSSLAPHKNFETVIRAVALMSEIDFDVVIAGGQNPAIFAKAGNTLPSSVKYAGYVTDSELKALYANASCFIFPSIYEGYGLPPTEAMASGCAVIASNAAAIPETCGDAALYFDPQSPSDLARVLQVFMAQPQLQEKMRSLGSAKAKTMRWRNTAIGLLNEIKRIA